MHSRNTSIIGPAFRGIARLLLPALLSGAAAAHEIEEGRGEDAGDYAERVARAQYLAPHLMDEGLRQRAVFKTQLAAMEAAGIEPDDMRGGPMMAFPFTAFPELQSYDTVRTLTVLVDFKDHRAAGSLPVATDIAANIYGEGTTEGKRHFPIESVHNYYHRASEGKVDLKGGVFDWYHFPNNRATYQSPTAEPGPNRAQRQAVLDNRALFAMAKEVLTAANATHDFSIYDNDHDGDIDCLTILYAGPRGQWSSFWWAYRWSFFMPEADSTRFDGKRLKQFVFQFVDVHEGTNDFNPRTLIHETGHAFGLADYYDYDARVGPPGGVGGLDMMDANIGNHCAFSRWLLDWIPVTAVGGGPPVERSLVASGAVGAPGIKAIAVFPGYVDVTAPAGELFLVENRTPVGNDVHPIFPPDSRLLIWHIDARLNATQTAFMSDNSYTSNKLIRLVRADSELDFGMPGTARQASPDTFFRNGHRFTPDSVPSSKRIDGSRSEVVVTDIVPNGSSIVAKIGIAGDGLLGMNGQGAPALQNSAEKALEKGIDFDRLQALDRELGSATPQEIEALWNSEAVKKAGAEEPQAELVRKAILSRWASKSGQQAVAAILDSQESSFAKEAYPLAMAAWANSNPAAASQWYLDPAQSDLRTSRDLVAGSDFAKRLFTSAALKDLNAAVSKVDLLTHPAEIGGAVEGLQAACEGADAGHAPISQKLSTLEKNKGVAEKVLKLDEAIENLQIDSLPEEDRARFREFLIERVSEE